LNRLAVPLVSIVIATRNRRQDLLVTLQSCAAQNHPSVEILVYDDASEDGSADDVRALFPQVRLFACPGRVGYIALRNRGFRDAAGEFVISLDDDAYFTDATTVSRIVEWFGAYPRAAALALPFQEPARTNALPASATPRPGVPLRQFMGCAHAIRRQAALELGGYPELLVHQGEERDLCIRLLDAGYEILAADTPPIIHLYSPQRERPRVDYYGFRNTLLFHWMRTPQPYWLPRMAMDTGQLLRYRFSWKSVPGRLKAIGAGWCGCIKHWRERRPVRRATYRKFRSLPRPSAIACAQERSGLPAPASSGARSEFVAVPSAQEQG
jgi:GT2 family glycosyltransferase